MGSLLFHCPLETKIASEIFLVSLCVNLMRTEGGRFGLGLAESSERVASLRRDRTRMRSPHGLS